MSLRPSPTPLHRNRWIHAVFGLSVSIVCLWMATRGLLNDPEAYNKSKHEFAHADYRTLIPIIAATAIFYWFKAVRWRLLLIPIGQFKTSRDLFPFVMIGFGFNNLLPVHMGEVLRVLLFTRHSHVKISTAASSVVLERIFDSISVLTLLSVGLIFVNDLDEDIRRSTMFVAFGVILLVIAMVLYVFCTQTFIAVVNRVLSRILPQRWVAKVTATLESGAAGLGALKQPHLVAGIMALSFGNWVVNGMVIHMALWSFGLPNSLLISCIVLGLTAVGAAIPSAPGYVGMIQFCFMTVLRQFTDNDAGILAASIYYHLTEYIIVTLTGLYYFNTTGVSLAEVKADLASDDIHRDSEAAVQEETPAGSP